jgi:hypothetical protein
MVVPDDDPFVWKTTHSEDGINWNRVQADARDMTAGGLKRPGLARYAIEGPPRKRNVKLAKQNDCLNTWGIEVREGLVIKKGDEIFW